MSIISHPSYKNISKVYDTCAPLRERFDLTWFCYDITFRTGDYAMITDHKKAFEPYYYHDLALVCVNQTGRTLRDGWHTTQAMRTKSQDTKPFEYFKQTFGSEFGLHWVKKSQHFDELFSFGFSCSDWTDFEFLMLNQLDLLEKFAQHFKSTLASKILEITQPQHRLSFESNPNTSNLIRIEKNKNNSKIMTSEGLNISLPPQQTLCLKLLTQGKTIQSIAETMGLSKRTIENYLLIARQKLDCKSLRELITKYYEQIR